MVASAAPSVHIALGRTAYRPGEVIIASIDVINHSFVHEPPFQVDRANGGGLQPAEAVLIESIVVELRGVERLDPTWVVTRRPNTAQGGVRGERTILESAPTSIAQNLLVPRGGKKSYSFRAKLPKVLPPTYRGTAVRYSYIVSVTIIWSASKQEGSGNGSKMDNSPNASQPVVARVPFRVWTPPLASGLTVEELTAEDHHGDGGIVPTSAMLVDIFWREKNAKTNWIAASDALSHYEDDDTQSRSSRSPSQSPRGRDVFGSGAGFNTPSSMDTGHTMGVRGGIARDVSDGEVTSAVSKMATGDGSEQQTPGAAGAGAKEETEVGVDLERVRAEVRHARAHRGENGRGRSIGRSMSLGEIEELFPDNVSEDLPTSTMPGGTTTTQSSPEPSRLLAAPASANGGLPLDQLPALRVRGVGGGGTTGARLVGETTPPPRMNSPYLADPREEEDSVLNTPTSPLRAPSRVKTYNIRFDDQILVRFTPRSAQSTYCLGEVVSGTLSFVHEEGRRRCLEVSVLLETQEIINPAAIHPSRKAAGATSITKVQTEFHELTSNLLSTHFIFTIPIDAPATFATPYVSVQWVLRFEFVASPNNTAPTSKSSTPAVFLDYEGTERGDWAMPIMVQTPRPRGLRGGSVGLRRSKVAFPSMDKSQGVEGASLKETP